MENYINEEVERERRRRVFSPFFVLFISHSFARASLVNPPLPELSESLSPPTPSLI